MGNLTKILFVTPNEAHHHLISASIDDSLLDAQFVSSYEEGIAAIKESQFHIVAANIYLNGGFGGLQFLENIKQQSVSIVRLLFGEASHRDEMISAVYRGDIYDFFVLGNALDDIGVQLLHAACEHDNRVEIAQLKKESMEIKEDWTQRYEELEYISNHEMEELAIYKQILDTLPIPVIATSRERRVVYINREAHAAFPSLDKLRAGQLIDDHLPDYAIQQFHYCIANDLSVTSDSFDLDDATVHMRIFPVAERRADLVVIILQELYATFSS